MGLVNQLLVLLSSVSLKRDQHDSRKWSYHSFSIFSTKSFTQAILNMQTGNHGMYSHAAKVWRRVAPPKVEMLVWFVVLGKLNTKDRLAGLNIINNDDVCCVLCNDHEESIEHLFFSYKYAWQLWCSCFNKWMVSWVMLGDAKTAFESWIELRLNKN